MKITNLLTVAAVALSFNFDSVVESMQQSQANGTFMGDAHRMVSNTLAGENLKKVLQVYGFITGMSLGLGIGIFIGVLIAGQ